MAELLRPDRNTQRRTNREKIRLYISLGMGISQIEDKLAQDNRITAQLHESVVWEIRFPEVQRLLLQGLDVAAIEERMRQTGWVWTTNLRNKARWEYHKDEIVELYNTLRSVDAVRAIMAKKGLAHKPRIYYEWLRDWGVSTSAKRSDPWEWSPHGSPTDSAGSNTTSGSGTGPYHPQISAGHNRTPSEISSSPLPDTIMIDDGTHALVSSGPAVNIVTPSQGACSNIHHDPRRMPIDETFHPRNFHDSPYLDASAPSSIRSLQNFPDIQNDMPNLQSPTLSIIRASSSEDAILVDDASSRSDEGQESSIYEYALGLHDSPALSPNTAIVVPLPGNRQSPYPLQHWPSQTQGSAPWTDPTVTQPLAGPSLSYRRDSVIASGPGSTRSSVVDTPHLLQPRSEIRDSFSQGSGSYSWASQKTVLHSISCNENHRGFGLNYHCCGSSPLQDLAFIAKYLSSQDVHRLICNYASEGAKLYDDAGNTFLHKLAILGAPWEYFEAAIDARIDPCHRNAYGQTFAHVLNISELHDKLMECLSSIRGRGIDFSQRDASGWTILHCLFSQPIPPQTAKEILKLVESPGRHLCRRDVFGRTPCDLFRHSFKQQASASPIWGSPEEQLQNLGIFKDVGILRLGDEDVDWQGDINSPDEMRVKLQNQYRQVIKNARGSIVVEAVDGSNAFHAQAGLITAQDVARDVGCIKKFISVGIDANEYDSRGRTPLEAIITQPKDYENELSKSEKVALLIENGDASVHSRNRLGHTPLYSAAIRGLDRTVEVLLKRNSHVNIRANDNTSLLKAVQDAFDSALTEYKKSQFEKNYYEAQCSRIEVCKELLERYGAVLNPNPAQFMGYAFGIPRFNDNQVVDVL